MGKITRRGSLALTAAVAVVLSSSTIASAAVDGSPLVPDTTTTADKAFRYGGQDRVETAIKASEAQYPNGAGLSYTNKTVTTVVITRSDDFPDALTAAPLADIHNAPVLITPSGKDLDPRVAAEVKRLRADKVIIVGGTGAVSVQAEASLKALAGNADVSRISGDDRYQTAVAVANATRAAQGAPGPATTVAATPVFLTTGTDFGDALAAGAAAAQAGGVVLLTQGDKFDGYKGKAWGEEYEASATLDYLFAANPDPEKAPILQANSITAVGGPAANAIGAGKVTDSVTQSISKVVGSDRYETSVKVAQIPNLFDKTATAGVVDGAHYAIANGLAFADAVVASAFIANQDGPLLLTAPDALPKSVDSYLVSVNGAKETVPAYENSYIFGGEAVVSASIATAVGAALNGGPAVAAPAAIGDLKLSTNGLITGISTSGAAITATVGDPAISVIPANVTVDAYGNFNAALDLTAVKAGDKVKVTATNTGGSAVANLEIVSDLYAAATSTTNVDVLVPLAPAGKAYAYSSAVVGTAGETPLVVGANGHGVVTTTAGKTVIVKVTDVATNAVVDTVSVTTPAA
ncbi:cell wall-binding repeat-containing protein [Georgenia yuyongxinii]|uniref:Cell wall-binding repeat-containing protein n=1 Tax=Georgenia yuyongxinii TaxID=2589797 RepID=A0A552WXU3_9MICO|nr:cell wall-binding repeat-containing protein [Georgenia yuyongxinii]TRW47584.1 hypothetical protein FJ693_00290 [Georgenia yuyongxinii]